MNTGTLSAMFIILSPGTQETGGKCQSQLCAGSFLQPVRQFPIATSFSEGIKYHHDLWSFLSFFFLSKLLVAVGASARVWMATSWSNPFLHAWDGLSGFLITCHGGLPRDWFPHRHDLHRAERHPSHRQTVGVNQSTSWAEHLQATKVCDRVCPFLKPVLSGSTRAP